MKRELVAALVILPLLFAGCLVEGNLAFDDNEGVVVEIASVDSEDGFIGAASLVLYSGIRVEEDFTTGFISFHTYPIPHNAVITGAYVLIGVHSVYPNADSVFLDVFVEPGFFAGRFEVFLSDEGNYLFLDVTDVLTGARRGGVDILQVSLEALGGDIFFEDGGNNMGTGLVPVLEVTYF